MLRCKELLSVIRPGNVILFLWNKEKKLVLFVFYYWRAECESEGHDHIRQKKEVNLLSLFRFFVSQIAILINLLLIHCHLSDNYLYAVLKKLKHEKYLFNFQNNHLNVNKEFMLFLL